MNISPEARLDLQPRDAHQVVEEATELLSKELADADIYVRKEFAPALPAALFSTEELREVLVIVLLNAIEAMPDLGCIVVRSKVEEATEATRADPSTSPPSVGPGIAQGDRVLCIEILDSGTGLATDDPLAPFNALTSTKTPSAAGHGLAIARKILDLHGGTIRIANREDEEGACVTISLRLA